MKSIEATGKKLNDAIQAGLAELGVTLDDVDVEILESGGFFKKAKVRLTVLEEEYAEAAPAVQSEAAPAQEERAEAVEAEAKPQPKQERRPKQDKPAEKKSERKEKKPYPPKKTLPPKEEKEYPPATEEQAAKAKAYVEGLLKVMNVEYEAVNVSIEKNVIKVDVDTQNAMVIGHRGETLDAIQVLTKRAIEGNDDKYLRVVTDCQGYRAKRESSLISLARKTADKCVKRGRKIALEPMDSAQRKIIHSALTDDERVFTRSDGREPNRRVVIFPNRSRSRYDD